MSITIEVARRVLEASKRRAKELRSPVSIAIVDAGGNLVLFERMMSPYGWVTGNISIAKASTAVMFNQSTDAVAQWGAAIPGFASSMAAMTNGRFIMAAGGWPIRVGGATVGGIGVSGGNAPGRDDEIARAGIAAAELPPEYPAQPFTAHPMPPLQQMPPAVPQARQTVQFGPPAGFYNNPSAPPQAPNAYSNQAPQQQSNANGNGNENANSNENENGANAQDEPASTHYLTADQGDPYEPLARNNTLNQSNPDQSGGQS